MGGLVKIALRNVFRNRGRSTLSIVAILFGVAVLLFVQGCVNGLLKDLIDDAVLAKVGAIEVHHHGYLDAEKDPLKLDLPGDAATMAKIRAVPGVVAVTPRIAFEGMLNNGTVSSMFMATAVDPATEYQVCPRRLDNVAKGSKPLDERSNGEALLGRQLVESLDAKPGATLSMLTATQRGAQNALDVTVRGMLPSRFVIESKRIATVPLAFAQELLRMDGRVTEYAIRIDDPERADEVAARLRAALGDGYDVDTWRKLAPGVAERQVRMRFVMVIISIILFLLVVTGIINTMLMNVSERVREIGTMLAVGVRRWRILMLFLLEAIALGVTGAVIGAALGWSLVAWMGTGLHLNPGGEPMVIYPYLYMRFVLLVIALAVAGTVLAALWPAWKASRMRPVEALRAN